MLSTRLIAPSASAERLDALIAARLAPGADRDAIDARIWDLFGETWAVMFTDLTGFSRRVAEFGIVHFLQIIRESLRLLIPVIEAHDGILLKVEGDSMLVIFRRADRAVDCALAMRAATMAYDAGAAAPERIGLCIGLGYGPMLRIGDQDVFGAEVNAASKLGEDTAKADEIVVTGAVMEACAEREGLRWERLDVVPPGARAAYRLRG
jgi:adenylate cyclase